MRHAVTLAALLASLAAPAAAAPSTPLDVEALKRAQLACFESDWASVARQPARKDAAVRAKAPKRGRALRAQAVTPAQRPAVTPAGS